MSSLLNSRILITGGAGFLSQHLCKSILKNHNAEIIYLLDVKKKFPNDLELPLERIRYVNNNLASINYLQKLISEISPTHIFHNAAFISQSHGEKETELSFLVNVLGTSNLLTALSNVELTSFVFTSTSEVYGDNQVPFDENQILSPTSPYSISKASAEMVVRSFSKKFNLPSTIIRPFNLYGEAQSPAMLIPQLFISLIKKEVIDVTEGKQTRESNYVGDICEGLILASISEKSIGETINLCSGIELPIKDLINKIVKIVDNDVTPNFGGLSYRRSEIWRMFGSNAKAKKILGWNPKTGLNEGLMKTIKWYNSNVNKI